MASDIVCAAFPFKKAGDYRHPFSKFIQHKQFPSPRLMTPLQIHAKLLPRRPDNDGHFLSLQYNQVVTHYRPPKIHRLNLKPTAQDCPCTVINRINRICL